MGDIMRRSLKVPSTEEGKFTMERCIAAEERVKALEAKLKNSVSSRLEVSLCNVHPIVHSFNLNDPKDKARLDGILSKAIRADMPCPICRGRYPGQGGR